MNPYEMALKKLARRSYSCAEIKERLLLSGAAEDEAADVIEKLLSLGYLNDIALAQELYDYYTLKKPCGPLLLRSKLKAKGLEQEVIGLIMQAYDDELEAKIAHNLASKYLRGEKVPTLDSLARYLQRKGFHEDIIQTTICRVSVQKNGKKTGNLDSYYKKY